MYAGAGGNYIVHIYKVDKLLDGICGSVADGAYIVARSLDDYSCSMVAY